MSLPYTVKKGDTLSAIARRHGFKTWQEIYNHPDNEAFRRKRPNPNLIHPGDVLMLPGLGPEPVPPSPPAPPPPEPELPSTIRFVIHRMGSETTIMGRDDQLFFHLTDMDNGLIGIYWLQPSGRPMTTLSPPAKFVSPSSSLTTKARHPVNKLEGPAVYGSRQSGGQLSSLFAIGLPSGGVQCSMPHHLIGPGGLIAAGTGDVSTAVTGDLRFIKMG